MNTLTQVLAALQRNDAIEAEALLKQGLQENPTDVDLHECSVLFYNRTKQPQEAYFHIEAGLRLFPSLPTFHNHKGNWLYRNGKMPEALASYLEALKLAPDTAESLCNAALCYVQLDNHAEARRYFEAALRANPDQFICLYNLGLLYRENKEHKKALYCFLKCTELRSEEYEGYYQMAIVSMEMRHHEEAEAYFLKALGLAPKKLELQFDYATFLHQQNRKDEALQYYQHVLLLNPEHEAANFMMSALSETQNVKHAPNSYLALLFNQYAPHYDHHLEKILKYQVPYLISEKIKSLYNINAHSLTLKIADLGCGTGLCGPLLKGFSENLLGIDLSEEMLKEARLRKCYDKLIQADMVTELKQHPKSFDLIIAADVLIYFGDLAPIFRSVRSSLKADGYFIFTVEQGEQDYKLNSSGRFQHSLAYLQKMAEATQFKTAVIEKIISRYQDNIAVEAYLVTCSGNASI